MLLLTFSCNSSKKDVNATQKKELIMEEVSEMAKLMNEMYAFNESIKQQIMDGNLNTNYPSNFDKIHTAVLTKSKIRGLDLTLRYNNAINACL